MRECRCGVVRVDGCVSKERSATEMVKRESFGTDALLRACEILLE